MISSLPNRPLYRNELDAIPDTDRLDLIFPASPASIQRDDQGRRRIYDLLVFMGETVATIAYVADEEAWTLVAKETDEDDDAYEVAYDKLLEYRGYEELDRREALRQTVAKLYGIPEDVIDANPEELDSLGDT